MTMAQPKSTLLPRTPDTWKQAWRQVMTQIPATCHHSAELIEAGFPQCEHQQVSPEWVSVFDDFADLSVCNKFIAAGGEGAAKSHDAALFAIARYMYDMLTLPRKPKLYWIIGADYEDAYKEWSYLDEFLGTDGLNKLATSTNSKGETVTVGRKFVKEGRDQCILTTNDGVKFVTLSAKDETKIAREEPDGVIGAEASRWSAEAFRRAIGRIARLDHSWLFASGSFESDDGGFHARFKTGQGDNRQRTKSKSIPSFANRHVYPQGESDYRIQELKADYSYDRYQERVLGRPAPPKGQVITRLDPTIHIRGDLTYEPREPVYLWIDPGTLVYCVLFVQIIRNQVRVIDEIYQPQAESDHVIAEARRREGWRYITTKGHVSDHAGVQRHMGAPPHLNTWKDQTRIVFETLGKGMAQTDKAEQILSFLNLDQWTGEPGIVFHPNCKGVLAEMGVGISPAADQGGGRWMREVRQDGTVGGIKKENDHGCSALAYGLGVHRGSIRPVRRKLPGQTPPTSYTAGFARQSEGEAEVPRVVSPLDYEAFPTRTITRTDGVEIKIPGKRMSQVEAGRRRPRAY